MNDFCSKSESQMRGAGGSGRLPGNLQDLARPCIGILHALLPAKGGAADTSSYAYAYSAAANQRGGRLRGYFLNCLNSHFQSLVFLCISFRPKIGARGSP